MTIAAPREKTEEMISGSLYTSSSKDHIHQGSGSHFQVIRLEKNREKGKKRKATYCTRRLLTVQEGESNSVALVIAIVISIAKVPAFACI